MTCLPGSRLPTEISEELPFLASLDPALFEFSVIMSVVRILPPGPGLVLYCHHFMIPWFLFLSSKNGKFQFFSILVIFSTIFKVSILRGKMFYLINQSLKIFLWRKMFSKFSILVRLFKKIEILIFLDFLILIAILKKFLKIPKSTTIEVISKIF